MKFSIVTCTWNSAATLEQTIDSVRRQQHADVEHVFVDGGSTDATLEIIARECPGARVVHGVGGGISKAMNAGIAAARGDVIAHLHSDDYYAGDGVLATVAAALGGTGACWSFGSMDTLRDGVRRSTPRRRTPYSPAAYARGSVAILHPTVFVRREVFERVGGFDEALRYAMDIDMWFRIGPLYAPAEIDATLAVFRVHAGSLSSAHAGSARREEWRVRMRYAKQWPLQTMICRLRHWRLALRSGAAEVSPA